MTENTTSHVYRSIDVATGTVLSEHDHATDAEISAVLGNARHAAASWGATSIEARAEIVRRVADLFAQRQDELGAIITARWASPSPRPQRSRVQR